MGAAPTKARRAVIARTEKKCTHEMNADSACAVVVEPGGDQAAAA